MTAPADARESGSDARVSSSDARVARECVQALYRQGPLASLIALVVGALIVAVMWDKAAPAALIAWYALIGVNQAVRIALWRAFHRENPEGARVAVWANRYALGMAVGGSLFGSTAFFMLPIAAPLEQAFLMVMISGSAAGSVSANAYHRPAMYAYLLTILVPSALALTWLALRDASLEYALLAFSYVFYLLVMLGFGRNQSEILRRTIAFSHRNDDLVAELRDKTTLAESAQRAAEQASLAKSQFFAAASHDLRQPLQALGLFAASLRETKREPADARRIDQILASVDSLESLFDELLDISKLDAGYVKPVSAHFRAQAMFERLENAYAPIAHKNGLALSFDDAGAVLHTDVVLIERVLGNFIANALRYTQQGSVSVRARPKSDRIVLEVADTGPGIPHSEHERVFDEFYQLGNPERDRRKGLGLGLATVKRIGQLLGSRVSLVSEPGRGSSFSIEVPAGDAARVAQAPVAPSEADVDALRGKVIGVVDDEREVREGLAEVLGLWRCKAVVAASAQDLCDQLDKSGTRPDALIADYRLREHETGAAAIALLRARYGAAIPALVMSGDTSAEIFTVVRAQQLPLLSKPVRASRLRAALQHLLSDARLVSGAAPGTTA